MARATSKATLFAALTRLMRSMPPVLLNHGQKTIVTSLAGGSTVEVLGMMMVGSRSFRGHLPMFGTMGPYMASNLTHGTGMCTKGAEVDFQFPVSVPVEDAYKLYIAGHRYLDVRTTEEFNAGHTSGAVNIPYLISSEGGMSKNPKFLQEVASGFGTDDKIIVGCRSGKRSLMAVEDLRRAGYSNSTNIESGYMAWPAKEA